MPNDKTIIQIHTKICSRRWGPKIIPPEGHWICKRVALAPPKNVLQTSDHYTCIYITIYPLLPLKI